MSRISCVSSRNNLSFDFIENNTNRIVAEFFPNANVVTNNEDIIVQIKSPQLRIRQISKRKIEICKLHLDASWIQLVVANEMALVVVGGRLTNDDIVGSWHPDPKLKLHSFRDFFNFIHRTKTPSQINALWENTTPPESYA